MGVGGLSHLEAHNPGKACLGVPMVEDREPQMVVQECAAILLPDKQLLRQSSDIIANCMLERRPWDR